MIQEYNYAKVFPIPKRVMLIVVFALSVHRLMKFFTTPRDDQSTRYRFSKPQYDDMDEPIATEVFEKKDFERKGQQPKKLLVDVCRRPWFGWLFVYSFVLFCFSTARYFTLEDFIEMYGSPQDYTMGYTIATLGLGFMEDFVCTTYFACILWMFDTFKQKVTGRAHYAEVIGNIATFVVSWLLFLVMMIPFVADLILVVTYNMRFTFALVATLIKERAYLKAAPISEEEIQQSFEAAAVLVLLAAIFALVRAMASWADLSTWNPTLIVVHRLDSQKLIVVDGVKYESLRLEDGLDISTSANEAEIASKLPFASDHRTYCTVLRISVILVGLVAVPASIVVLRCICSPLVAFAGLNVTVNELFGHAFQPPPADATLANGEQSWVEAYIHPTEKYELFGNDTLYRRTTGFKGSLAFDVEVSSDNPPNVLVIGVESFRFRDSRYLVGEKDPSNLFKGTNMTVTPNFDKWAKRGVALRNIWSSLPTSRSLESILFAQVPYDSAVKTAISGGRNDTTLSGLPQLFAAKGYETYFTTGATITLDNWNVFLPTHGFDNVWEFNVMKKLAEKRYGIKPSDWNDSEKRKFRWGIHDDLSFQILGDMLVQMTNDQKQEQAEGKLKKPAFITHYTISSHGPFTARPKWYSQATKPDFSALCEGEKRAKSVKNYLEMRHFTDMELGKFMDRMETEGVLNDTIVVIVGDHGSSPEVKPRSVHDESSTRVAAAIIAEGRLGSSAGITIDDAAEHYDILNTLADIIGLPKEGFNQTGVGRSLKRKAAFGERLVFSNDPLRKMSIVRGHQRLRYDRVTSSMTLHDIESDYMMTTDLLPTLSPKEQAEWKAWRKSGRRIAAYYTKRWDENCLLAVNCTGDT